MRRATTILAGAALACLLAAAPAAAQTPFALRGVGQRLTDGDARMLGRGGWGMTVADSLHPGFKNLASLATLRHTVVSFTATGESAANESPLTTRNTDRVITPDIRAALPVAKSRLAVTAGFKLNRSSEWSTFIDSTWSVWEDTLGGNVQFVRGGTEFQVPLGVALQATPWLAVSGAVNLESGSLRESLAYSYVTPQSGSGVPYYGSNLKISEDRYSGTSLTASALLRPRDGVRLGVSYTGEHDVDVDRKVEFAGVGDRATSSFVISQPAEWKLGASVRLGPRWTAGGDLQTMAYSKLTGREEWASDLRDELFWCAGIERSRANVRRGGWSNLPLRAGFGWRRWAYTLGGDDVIEKTFSVGTGFPFGQDMGQMDVGLSYALIGSMADNGMESRVWRLSVSVTGLESWW